jgi:hypothetical protein
VDYNETYSPVVNTTSIRLLLAHAAKESLEIAQFDVKTAFLYGTLDEDIFMEQPEGFSEDSSKVCHLKKSLYGLKQAPRQWNKKFSDFLKSVNLKTLENDECIFYRKEPLLIVAIYVDDGIVLAKDKKEISQIISKLQEAFEIHLVNNNTYLGFQIDRSQDGEIMLHQTSYINKILKRYNMQDANPTDAPVAVIRGETKDEPLEANVPYREAIGSLMYAACQTRIDIMYAAGRASRKNTAPTKQDWEDVKRIFRYLKDKQSLGIVYSRDTKPGIEAYCDADFAGDLETSRSTTGLVVMYAGAPIHWKSSRQSLVTLSSTEAEVVSLCTTTKDIMWLRKIATELDIIKDDPIPIFCDNMSAIKITTKKKSIQRTRHMSAQAAYVVEQTEDKNVSVHHVRTDDQLADMLTKPTTSRKFVSNCSLLMKCLAILITLFLCCGEAFVFDRVAPIVWTEVKKPVEKKYQHYMVDIRYTSPCPLLKKIPMTRRKREVYSAPVSPYGNVMQPYEAQATQQQGVNHAPDGNAQLTSFDPRYLPPPNVVPQLPKQEREEDDIAKALREAESYCNMVFKEYIETPMKEAMSVQLRVRGPSRQPRMIGEVITGFFFSNILSTVIDKLFLQTNHQEIEERKHLIDSKIEKLNKEINTTMVMELAQYAAMKSMSEVVKHTKHRLSVFVNTFPDLVFTANYLVMKMVHKHEAISRITYEARRTNKLDLYALATLLDHDLFTDVDDDSAMLKSIDLKHDHFRLEFTGHTVDNSTTVYRVDAFRFWSNLIGESTLMEYAGERYLIYNSSSNCVKAIPEPANRFVNQRCFDRDGKDSRLAVWRKVLTVEDPYKQPAVTDVKLSWPYNYVYCYRLNITIHGETTKCPPLVFRVNYTLGWNTTDHNQPAATKEEIDRVMEFETMTHQVHSVHFEGNEHFVDENAALDTIRKLSYELKQMQQENLAISLPVSGGGITNQGMIKMLTFVLVCTMIVIIVLLIYKHKRDTVRHRKVLRTVTDGIYGDGTYDMVRKQRNPNQMPNVNVTLTQAPPLPPKNDVRIDVQQKLSVAQIKGARAEHSDEFYSKTVHLPEIKHTSQDRT